MSDEQTTAPEPPDNKKLIMVAAQLLAASVEDVRLVPIAEQAKRLVLESDLAVLELFQGYLASLAPPVSPSDARPVPSTIGVAARSPQQTNAQLLDELKELLKGSK